MTLPLYGYVASAFENGRLNLLFSAVLMSALPPEAAVKLESSKGAAKCPLRTLRISLSRTDFDPNPVRFHLIIGFREP